MIAVLGMTPLQSARRATLVLLAAVGAWMALDVPARAAAGDLDPSFSGDGKVSLIAEGTFVARGLALQGDGRIVAAGYACDPGDSASGVCTIDGDSSFRVARLTADGGLDPEFGNGGTVTTSVGSARSQAFDVLVQPDGRIVVGGTARDADGRDAFALVRYDAGGQVDRGFADQGVALTPIGIGFSAVADLATQADGAIVAAGQAVDADGRRRFALARYRADGTLDPTFGSWGTLMAGGATYGFALGAWAAPDGGILTAGIAGPDDNPANHAFGLQKLTGAGAADSSFGPDGFLQWAVGTSSSFANAVTGHADGRWLAAGAATGGDGRQVMALAQGRPDGKPDPTFGGGDGVGLYGAADGAVAADVALAPGAKAVAAGHAVVGEEMRFALLRAMPDGSLDPAFGGGGMVTTPWQRFAVARATALAVQPDGAVVVAGIGCLEGEGTQCEGGTAHLALARYLPDPAPGDQPPGVLPPPDTVAPRGRLGRVPRAIRRRTLLRRGLRVRVHLGEEAAVDLRLMGRKGGRYRRTLARRSLPFAARTRVVRLRPDRRLRRGRVRLEARLSDRAGNVRLLRRTIRVR